MSQKHKVALAVYDATPEGAQMHVWPASGGLIVAWHRPGDKKSLGTWVKDTILPDEVVTAHIVRQMSDAWPDHIANR